MSKGVTWFKMFLSFAPLINAIPSQNAGEGLQAAMRYFKTGEEPEDDLPELSFAVYNMLKSSIDQAFTDCEERSEKARKSIMARWHGSDTTEYDRIRPNTEETRIEPEKNQKRPEAEETTTTDNTYMGEPAGGGAGGGGFPPEILEYAREKAQGANNPAAYEAAILERIRKARYKTIEEVRAADDQRKSGKGYADEDDFY